MPDSDPALEPVTVFASADPSAQALAGAVLEEYGIPFFHRYAEVQHLIGMGQIGGSNLATGLPEIQVALADEPKARLALAEALGETSHDWSEVELESEDRTSVDNAEGRRADRYGRYSAVAAFLSVWAIARPVGVLAALVAVHFGVRALMRSRGQTPLQKLPGLLGLLVGVASIVLSFAWRYAVAD